MRWNTPLSEAHADGLIGLLELSSVRSVLDLGCGWGELLIRVVRAAGGGCRGVGVDTDEQLLDRGRRSAEDCGVADRVTFVCGRAQDWDEPAERVLCVGASHALSGTPSALATLRALVAPGGLLLFGDGCWEGPRTPEADAIFGEDVLALDQVVDHVREAGWRVLSLTTADQLEWDEFESSSRRGFEQWLRANPDASDAPAVREHLDLRLAEYVKGYRGVLGFVYLVLTPPA